MLRISLSAVTLFLLLTLQAAAQVNVDTSSAGFQIDLNLSNPGARSLALGGAFVGLADDATAAYANPAGLTVLSDPEVSFEGRSTRFNNTFVQKGRTFGSPTGRGIDTVAGVVTGVLTYFAVHLAEAVLVSIPAFAGFIKLLGALIA